MTADTMDELLEEEAWEAFEQNFPSVEWPSSRWTFVRDYR